VKILAKVENSRLRFVKIGAGGVPRTGWARYCIKDGNCFDGKTAIF